MPSADHINTTLTLTLNTVTSVKLPFLLLIKGMLGARVCVCVFVCVTRKTAVRQCKHNANHGIVNVKAVFQVLSNW